MSAEFYVKRALSDLIPLRHRLLSTGIAFDAIAATDVTEIASVVCDCEVLLVPQLSEERTLEILESEYGVSIKSEQGSDRALAGALCVAQEGVFRWIFVRAEDSPERRRFTIAHELGHLYIDALPELEKDAAAIDPIVRVPDRSARPRLYGRCPLTEAPPETLIPENLSRALTPEDLREFRAHHFAAELLMPVEGILLLAGQTCGRNGVRTQADCESLIRAVADRYLVSMAAARRRVEKDLRIVPLERNPNLDFFSR